MSRPRGESSLSQLAPGVKSGVLSARNHDHIGILVREALEIFAQLVLELLNVADADTPRPLSLVLLRHGPAPEFFDFFQEFWPPPIPALEVPHDRLGPCHPAQDISGVGVGAFSVLAVDRLQVAPAAAPVLMIPRASVALRPLPLLLRLRNVALRPLPLLWSFVRKRRSVRRMRKFFSILLIPALLKPPLAMLRSLRLAPRLVRSRGRLAPILPSVICLLPDLWARLPWIPFLVPRRLRRKPRSEAS